MTRERFAASVTTTVLGTLVIAALGYGGMVAARPHQSAEVPSRPAASPSPSPLQPASPSSSPLPPASAVPVGSHIVWDEDMVDQEGIWMLLSDCNSESASTCHYSVARTENAATWSPPVVVGPLFSSADGDAPRTIRFLDHTNGFVYGHSSAFVTHDGGLSWADAGFKGEVVGIAAFENTLWAVTRPCAKGVTCRYEVRSSHDGGVSWSPPHQLPAAFAPESLVAFRSGVIVSALPPGGYEMTADQGVSWQETIKSPCAAGQFRSRATTADGIEIWVLCQGYPYASGVINDPSMFVTSDAGRTWSRLSVPGTVPAWLVSPKPKVALADGNGFIVLTTDLGLTWSRVAAGDGAFVFARFTSPDGGWAMDVTRHAWLTFDGGNNWVRVTILPSTLP